MTMCCFDYMLCHDYHYSVSMYGLHTHLHYFKVKVSVVHSAKPPILLQT